MKQFQNILVAVDLRFEDHPALQSAVRIAERNQAKLKIVDVVPEVSWLKRLAMPSGEETQERLAEDKRQKLEALAEPLRKRGLDVTTKILSGKTSLEIVHEVLRSGHDLVFRVTKGAHSRRTGFFGTTSMRLLRQCPCAVWLVRTDATPRFAHVLAAVDPAPHDVASSAMSKKIMDLGLSIAEGEESQFRVVHVWELRGGNTDESWLIPNKLEETLLKAKTDVAEALDTFLLPYELDHLSDSVHLVHDENGPARGISELAKKQEVDLIVMGTIARTGLAGAFMGNTAERVIDRIECSLLAVKPDDFESPIRLPSS